MNLDSYRVKLFPKHSLATYFFYKFGYSGCNFKVETDDPRPALIRKESKDFKKTAKNSRWLQGSLVSAVGKCKSSS